MEQGVSNAVSDGPPSFPIRQVRPDGDVLSDVDFLNVGASKCDFIDAHSECFCNGVNVDRPAKS